MHQDSFEVSVTPKVPFVAVKASWKRIFIRSKPNPALFVADRFLKIFQDHGVAISQIPRLIPEICLADISSSESLLPVLTVEVLKKTADLFGVQLAWLEGVSDEIYGRRWCYKQPERFFAELATLKKDSVAYPVVAYCDKDSRNGSWLGRHIVLVMREKCADLNEKEINRYRIFRDEWDWGYWKCRIQLKAMVRIVEKRLQWPVPLYLVSRESLRKLESGFVVPCTIPKRRKLHDISLEDFSLSPEESAVSKESDELPKVLEYIKFYCLEEMADCYGI